MKIRLTILFFALCTVQGMMAQLTSLGLVEESNIATVDKGGYINFIPELSFADDYLYVATPEGLYRNQYKSQSEWEKLPLTDELVLDFEARGDTLIALTRNQLLYSVDGGKTVRTDSIADITGKSDYSELAGMAVHPHDATHVFVATKAAGLWQTYDGGGEWKEITESDGGRVYLTNLLYNPQDTTRLIGIYNNGMLDYGALYFSHNGGVQWKSGNGEYAIVNISQVCNVAFHPTQKDKVVACGNNIYALSDDGGVSWTYITDPNNERNLVVEITDVLFDTRNPDILYGADWFVSKKSSTVVLRSTDGGYTWETFFSESIAPKGYVLAMDMKDNLLALYTFSGGIYLLDVDAIDTSVSPIVNDGSESAYYDIQGRKVTHPTRGIYIKEGRKVVIF